MPRFSQQETMLGSEVRFRSIRTPPGQVNRRIGSEDHVADTCRIGPLATMSARARKHLDKSAKNLLTWSEGFVP